LETGFIYIKVVVVTRSENCGKVGKEQVRTFIYLCSDVGKEWKSVGRAVYRRHYFHPFLINLRITHRNLEAIHSYPQVIPTLGVKRVKTDK
jgi:hypothetical protein